MEATVAERGQITLPKAVRDALGLTKGTTLKVELDGGRIVLRKNVSETLRTCPRHVQAGRLRTSPIRDARDPCRRRRRAINQPGESARTIAIDASVLIDLLTDGPRTPKPRKPACGERLRNGRWSSATPRWPKVQRAA